LSGGSHRIKDIASSERPRERLARLGAGALADAELVAITLRSGVRGTNALQLAQSILHEVHGIIGLQRVSYDNLKRLRGLGPAKAAQLKAAVEIGRRIAVATPEERPRIQSPEDAANLLSDMGGLEREHLRVLNLDTRNQLIRMSEVYRGSLNTSWIRVGELFRDSVRLNAAAILVAHNHPSGDPSPSPEDIAVTKTIIEAGRLLDIEVLDHLVIGQGRFVSMKSKGLAFGSAGKGG
jgi:DNA repair protein RadC